MKFDHQPEGYQCGAFGDMQTEGWGFYSPDGTHVSGPWYDRRLALAVRLHDGVWCPECQADVAHVVQLDEKTSSQPWCTECDVEMGGICEDVWPGCLTWSDDQAAEVERWLADSTSEIPEVMRG